MYFSMDDIGQENVDSVRRVPDSASKWRFIDRVASEFGFTGIQLCPKYPEEYGLDTAEVPDYLRRSFRLTYHFGDCGTLLDDGDQQRWSGVFADRLEIASAMGAEDVSVHPPVLADYSSLPVSDRTEAERRSQVAKERLLAILDEWLGRFGSRGITLSLETHVTPLVFAIAGIGDYSGFIRELPGLGTLVDISHNFYDGQEVTDVMDTLDSCRITGFHLSDAVRGRTLLEGTHLPIGEGGIDFRPILERFADDPSVYGALEVRGPAAAIQHSLNALGHKKRANPQQ